MLVHTLRKVLWSKQIAESMKKTNGYIRQTIAWMTWWHLQDTIDYEVAWQVLQEIRDRHHNYTLEQDSFYRRTGSVDSWLKEKCEQERQDFLSENT